MLVDNRCDEVDTKFDKLTLSVAIDTMNRIARTKRA
jgi:hypothetical protein